LKNQFVWSLLGEDSPLRRFRHLISTNIFQGRNIKKKLWKNTCIRTLTSLALPLRASFAIRAFLRLAFSLLLLLSAIAFSNAEFFEVLGDLSIVDSVIFKTICFNVMYQLT